MDISYSQMSFRILTGMLFGPLDFETEKDLIILMISSGLTGWRKIEFRLLFLRKLEKCWLEGGTVDLTLSATDVKKLKIVSYSFRIWRYDVVYRQRNGILCFLGL